LAWPPEKKDGETPAVAKEGVSDNVYHGRLLSYNLAIFGDIIPISCPSGSGARTGGLFGQGHRRGSPALHPHGQFPARCQRIFIQGRFFSCPLDEKHLYQSVEKAIPGFFNCRLAKDASANLTIFLALKDEAKFDGTSCAAPARFSTGCSACVRHVERNPIGVVKEIKHAWDYEWSSARYHAGMVNNDPLVTEDGMLAGIDDWRLFLSKEDEDLDFLREKTRTGRPCGSETF
jgi:hypothetical protein